MKKSYVNFIKRIFVFFMIICLICTPIIIYLKFDDINKFFGGKISVEMNSLKPSAYEQMENHIKTNYNDDSLYILDFTEYNSSATAKIKSKKSKDTYFNLTLKLKKTYFNLNSNEVEFRDTYEEDVLSKKNTMKRQSKEIRDKKYPGYYEFFKSIKADGNSDLHIFINSEDASKNFIKSYNEIGEDKITSKMYYFTDIEPDYFSETYKNIELDSDVNTDDFLFKLSVYHGGEKDIFSYTYIEKYIKNVITTINQHGYSFNSFDFKFVHTYDPERRYLESKGGYNEYKSKIFYSGDSLTLKDLTEEQILSENFYQYIQSNIIKESWTKDDSIYINPNLTVLD